jgi:hypothetical protein
MMVDDINKVFEILEEVKKIEDSRYHSIDWKDFKQ